MNGNSLGSVYMIIFTILVSLVFERNINYLDICRFSQDQKRKPIFSGQKCFLGTCKSDIYKEN